MHRQTIKILIEAIMVVLVEAMALTVMYLSVFAQAIRAELGTLGFCISLLINGFNSLLFAKKSRVLWFVSILIIALYLIIYSRVRTLWQTP